jgi:hypothetical protein
VVIRHDGKLIREPVGQNRKEAERALDARRGDVARRTYRVLRDIRFDEWADSWLAGFTGKENSRRVYAHTPPVDQRTRRAARERGAYVQHVVERSRARRKKTCRMTDWIEHPMMRVDSRARAARLIELAGRCSHDELHGFLGWWPDCDAASSGPEGEAILALFREAVYSSEPPRRFHPPTTVYRGNLGEDPRLGSRGH